MVPASKHTFPATFVPALALPASAAWFDFPLAAGVHGRAAFSTLAWAGLSIVLLITAFALVMRENRRCQRLLKKLAADFKGSEEALRQATEDAIHEKARLQFIFDSLPVGISLKRQNRTDPAVWETIEINDAHLRICGLTREQAGEPGAFERISDPEDYKKQTRLHNQVMAGKTDHFTLDKRYLLPDGRIVWAIYSMLRRRYEDGGCDELSMVVDITARKQAEEALRRSEENLAVTLHSIGDAVLTTDAAGRVTRLNPIAEKLTGWTQAAAIGRPIAEIFHIINEETHEPADIPVDKVLASGDVCGLANHTVLIAHDGREYPISDSAAPIRDARGNVLGVVLVFRDVTEERRAQRQLAEANTELEAFSYSVSHDLRAPLRHVQGYVEMLRRATDGQLSEKGLRYLKTITEAGAEMGRLIDDLLAFSRMGRAEMRESAVELDGLVQETLRGLELEMRDRNIVWKISQLPQVEGDSSMLRQVLANLVGNAVKYTRGRDPARIEIACAGAEDGRMIFFVRDTGAGFDMQYAHKLFGVFQRLHRTDEFEGTGIGLATVRRIISRHEGRVWAEGKLGEGATFYFTLKPAATV